MTSKPYRDYGDSERMYRLLFIVTSFPHSRSIPRVLFFIGLCALHFPDYVVEASPPCTFPLGRAHYACRLINRPLTTGQRRALSALKAHHPHFQTGT